MIVTDYQKADKAGVFIGTFTVHYDTSYGQKWEELKLFMKNGHRWVAFASRSIKQPDGKYTYHPTGGFEFVQDHAKFEKAAIAALDAFCGNGGQGKGQICQSEARPLAYKDD